MRFKTYLFDFDGTLVDSSADYVGEIKSIADYYIHDFTELSELGEK